MGYGLVFLTVIVMQSLWGAVVGWLNREAHNENLPPLPSDDLLELPLYWAGVAVNATAIVVHVLSRMSTTVGLAFLDVTTATVKPWRAAGIAALISELVLLIVLAGMITRTQGKS